jgi:nucleoside-diphosphate-sugar epimerase
MITVLGAEGFIGSHLIRRLAAMNMPYHAPPRSEQPGGENLGDVIYCIGLTADFRERPLDTVEAHVCKLLEVVRDRRFDTLTYLSSTRLYGSEIPLAREEGRLHVDPGDPGDLYNISKIMGEALLRACGRPVRIARLSNVYGGDLASDNFLSAIIRQAVQTRNVVLETTLDSEKDYISIAEAVDLLIQIASGGQQVVYNVASGNNVTNREIVQHLAGLTGCRVEVRPDAKTVKFPPVDVDRIRSEFGYEPARLLENMEGLVRLYKDKDGGGAS